MLDWLNNIDLQRRARTGLNNGEAHYALKRAVSLNRRDRSTEGLQRRIARPNLLTAIIIYWNTWKCCFSKLKQFRRVATRQI
jgi:TnpA family transposase